MYTLVITACMITITPAKAVKPKDVNCFQAHSIEVFQKLEECEARGADELQKALEDKKYLTKYFVPSCVIKGV